MEIIGITLIIVSIALAAVLELVIAPALKRKQNIERLKEMGILE